MCGWEVRGVSDSLPSIHYDNTTLTITTVDGLVHTIACSSIVVVGERTDVGGPHVEDYWLVFVLTDGTTWEIGSEDPLFGPAYDILGEALAASPFTPGLCNRTDVASRILWPIEHRDAALISPALDGQTHHSWSTVVRKLLADHGYAY